MVIYVYWMSMAFSKRLRMLFWQVFFYHQMILHQASGSQQPGDATGGLAV